MLCAGTDLYIGVVGAGVKAFVLGVAGRKPTSAQQDRRRLHQPSWGLKKVQTEYRERKNACYLLQQLILPGRDYFKELKATAAIAPCHSRGQTKLLFT